MYTSLSPSLRKLVAQPSMGGARVSSGFWAPRIRGQEKDPSQKSWKSKGIPEKKAEHFLGVCGIWGGGEGVHLDYHLSRWLAPSFLWVRWVPWTFSFGRDMKVVGIGRRLPPKNTANRIQSTLQGTAIYIRCKIRNVRFQKHLEE